MVTLLILKLNIHVPRRYVQFAVYVLLLPRYRFIFYKCLIYILYTSWYIRCLKNICPKIFWLFNFTLGDNLSLLYILAELHLYYYNIILNQMVQKTWSNRAFTDKIIRSMEPLTINIKDGTLCDYKACIDPPLSDWYHLIDCTKYYIVV